MLRTTMTTMTTKTATMTMTTTTTMTGDATNGFDGLYCYERPLEVR